MDKDSLCREPLILNWAVSGEAKRRTFTGNCQVVKTYKATGPCFQSLHSPAELIMSGLSLDLFQKVLVKPVLTRRFPLLRCSSHAYIKTLWWGVCSGMNPLSPLKTRYSQEVPRRLESWVALFIVYFVWCEGHILQGYGRLEEMPKKLTLLRFFTLFCHGNRARYARRVGHSPLAKGAKKLSNKDK